METQESDSIENICSHQKLVGSVSVMIENMENPVVSERCIYRVPLRVRRLNEAAYTPHVISIGPFHHGDQMLKSMESMQEVKLIYLKSFLDWSNLTLEFCISKVREWEIDIRNCYAEKIQQKSDDFVRMILFDACFIIEHFHRNYNAEQWEGRDPLLLNKRLFDEVAQDLTLLENQLPFFVLERLYNHATHNNPAFPSFLRITINYFESLNPQNIQPRGVSVKHFTDLQRKFYLSPRVIFPERLDLFLEHLYSATELVEAGVEFKVDKENHCFLELKYDKGVLTMPHLDITDETEIHFRNIVEFEQNHYPLEVHITDYLFVLDFLINSERDGLGDSNEIITNLLGDSNEIITNLLRFILLIHKEIITNLLGDSNEVTTIINGLGSGLVQRNVNSEYLCICKQLNAF